MQRGFHISPRSCYWQLTSHFQSMAPLVHPSIFILPLENFRSLRGDCHHPSYRYTLASSWCFDLVCLQRSTQFNSSIRITNFILPLDQSLLHVHSNFTAIKQNKPERSLSTESCFLTDFLVTKSSFLQLAKNLSDFISSALRFSIHTANRF